MDTNSTENPNFNKYDIAKTGLVVRKTCLMVGIVLTELPTTEGGGGPWAPSTPLPAPLGFIDDNDDGSTMGSPQRKNPYGVNQILAEPVLSKVRSYRNHKRIKDFTSLVKGLRV